MINESSICWSRPLKDELLTRAPYAKNIKTAFFNTFFHFFLTKFFPEIFILMLFNRFSCVFDAKKFWTTWRKATGLAGRQKGEIDTVGVETLMVPFVLLLFILYNIYSINNNKNTLYILKPLLELNRYPSCHMIVRQGINKCRTNPHII